MHDERGGPHRAWMERGVYVESAHNLRRYGAGPFRVALLHGGPGAPGDMAPVARELAERRGVLEPLQTQDSIQGQVEELRSVVERYGDPPLTLVGWSWGAWLGYLFAAGYPALVEKLILVGSGPFEEEYVPEIARTRLSRLTAEERRELETIQRALADGDSGDKDALLARFGALFERTDAYDPIPQVDSETGHVDFHIFDRVWGEAAQLRASGALLDAGREIRCEVVALHGEYDPHPARGVRDPLERVVERFRFLPIDRCGHKPWSERTARAEFFELLEREL